MKDLTRISQSTPGHRFFILLQCLMAIAGVTTVKAQSNLQITEIFSGQAGDDLTADWFEITNEGDAPWTSAADPALYYDDESQDPLEATLIEGIEEIQPGSSAIVVITGEPLADVMTFENVWWEVIDLTNVPIGWTDGAGLGGGGDLVALWVGDPAAGMPVDTASYPDTDPFDGQSYDVDLGMFSIVGNANGAVQTVALGGNAGDVPNIGSPGNGPAIAVRQDLMITEIFSGQAGDDLTADWFEIVNEGTAPWVSGTDPDLYYDDESMDPASATLVEGISEIQPGGTAIVVIGNEADATAFVNVWSLVIDLTGVGIGYSDGAGLGAGGDLVTLWTGDPNTTAPVDTASYPDTEADDGKSFDVTLMAFSEVGNANGAVATIALGGDGMDVPNIGSPGNGKAIATFQGLVITEIFSGQGGDDLTADWFEIVNNGDEAWVSGTHPGLFYDDVSMDPLDATLIEGISRIDPGQAAIVVIGTDADASEFFDVWSVVIDLDGIEIGHTDGAGLGAGGDLVTLWAGDPTAYVPADTATYPDTELFDGKSYDVSLMAFSEIGNANNAVATIALGGAGMDVPNIGSPGNQDPVSGLAEADFSDVISIYPNPGPGKYAIAVEDGGGLLRVAVYDLNGRLLQSRDFAGETRTTLDLTSLNDGMYVVRLQLAEGVGVVRVVKE